MHPTLQTHCTTCSESTPIPFSAAAFSQTHYCSHCGAASTGITTKSPESSMSAQQHDELAGLFARSLTFASPTPPPDVAPALTTSLPDPIPAPTPTYYASTHYTPTRHMVPIRFVPQPAPTPEPTVMSDAELAALLTQNSINPMALYPAQIALFRNADSPQRLRLLELWRISPPSAGGYDLAKEAEGWRESTLAREEGLARVRYERLMAAREFGSGGGGLAGAGEVERPATAPEKSAAEPYMMSGYEMLARKEYETSQRTDPVYNTGLWSGESRLGGYDAMRAWPEAKLGCVNGLDEEMVM
ncbi:hypothetical protein EJ06DRAFT_25586 [Trichodelitschia bisporula]|uniref:Uncharacterized protein n=1 Tax=Trichodelitschia bisporula TaxID=703511 RepID=A0A6G1IBQ9_9PEZI|nr:hypothetical protein EJ06DRAFT_25586 [Trichodelitschia bisporula]